MEQILKTALAEIKSSLPADQHEIATQYVTYYLTHHVPKRMFDYLNATTLARFLLDRFRFVASGKSGSAKVVVHSPSSNELGGAMLTTTVETLMGDRPFILDSVREYLRRQGYTIHLTLHPVLTVERDGDRVVRIADPQEAGPKESHIYIQLSRIEDPTRLEQLRRDLSEILSGVQASVDGFPAMLTILKNRLETTEVDIFPYTAGEEWRREVRDFLDWLRDGNFIFMGYTRFRGSKLASLKGEPASAGIMVPELGIPTFQKALNDEIQGWTTPGKGRDDSLFVIKTNLKSILHRHDSMDLIGLREYGHGSDKPIGGSAFVGLFSTRMATERLARIPILRMKYNQVLELLNYRPGSHNRKAAESILETLPKEELFYFSPEELKEEVQRLLEVEGEGATSVTMRPTEGGRRYSPTITLEKNNFSATLGQKIRETFVQTFSTPSIREYTIWTEGELIRLQYYITDPGRSPRERELEGVRDELLQGVESWDRQMLVALKKVYHEQEVSELLSRFVANFPPAYRSQTLAEDAVKDLVHLKKVEETGETQIGASDVTEGGRTVMTQLSIYTPEHVELSALIPLMENMALNVNRQMPSEITFQDGRTIHMMKFWVRDDRDEPLVDEAKRAALMEGISKVLSGAIEDDPLNKLILEAGLDWWSASLFITFRNYLAQGTRTPREDINQALVRNPGVVKAMYRYFEAKFSPRRGPPTGTRNLTTEQEAFVESLRRVDSISEDRILRQLFKLIQATLRTNYYRVKGPDYYLSIKIESGKVEGLPDPKPLYEVYVHGVGMEGIHLRGGKVARGGLRWSERPDDFRTEILGLMKTQMVKNAVIVPVGSKGGFVIKRMFADHRSTSREVAHQYRFLIRGLLDVTDNLVAGKVIHPPDVVIHDGEDPYLVVAADKGTATFSDIANEISNQYGFWLGDAFASGGSRGYNHKELGITAKGAWECVKRNFREMGIDAMTQPIRVSGIGDLAGDVFGNGLIMSPTMRLVAAFNHAHIFLDPDPKPESFAERQRMFNLPRSTWRDYNASLISAGGGIYDRAAKVIALSPQAQVMLGTTLTQVNGEELIRLILKAEVDLLWNGGIGTYIKATTETHEVVGDKVNDPVRIDATEVRAKVIGEGGNLGVTQRGRTELDLHGVRLNTDAIDNSAGVDCSDHEVNLKIMTTHLIEAGKIQNLEARDHVLKALTDEVERQVLADNFWQSLVISIDRLRSKEDVAPFIDLMTTLAKEKGFSRSLEKLSNDTDLQSFRTNGIGIPRPQLSVLLSWAKMLTFDRLNAGTLVDEPYMEKFLVTYFPKDFVAQFGKEVGRHRLKREIIGTVVTNKVINQAGTTFFDRMAKETGANYDQITRSYIFVNDLLGFDHLRERIFDLDNKVPAEITNQAHLVLEVTASRIARNLLVNPPWPVLPLGKLEAYTGMVDGLRRHVSQNYKERLNPEQTKEASRFLAAGVPEDLVASLFTLRSLLPTPYLIPMTEEWNTSLEDAFEAYYLVGSVMGFDHLFATLAGVYPQNPWEKAFNERLYHHLRDNKRRLTETVLSSRKEGEAVRAAFDRYLSESGEVAQNLLKELEQLKHQRTIANAIPVFLFQDLFARMPGTGAPAAAPAEAAPAEKVVTEIAT